MKLNLDKALEKMGKERQREEFALIFLGKTKLAKRKIKSYLNYEHQDVEEFQQKTPTKVVELFSHSKCIIINNSISYRQKNNNNFVCRDVCI